MAASSFCITYGFFTHTGPAQRSLLKNHARVIEAATGNPWIALYWAEEAVKIEEESDGKELVERLHKVVAEREKKGEEIPHT